MTTQGTLLILRGLRRSLSDPKQLNTMCETSKTAKPVSLLFDTRTLYSFLKSAISSFNIAFAVCMFLFNASVNAQVVTPEVVVEDVPGDATLINVGGTERLQVNSSGITVTGTAIMSASEVLGSQKVNGDLKVGQSINQFDRWTGISSGVTHRQRFSTEFSAGITVEVTLSGNVGPSASTMFAKKVAYTYYQYSNTQYKKNGVTIFNLGPEASNITIDIVPTGASNQFDITVYNGNGDVVNTTVRMDFTTRGGASVNYVGAY